jgi:hypothetical protein
MSVEMADVSNLSIQQGTEEGRMREKAREAQEQVGELVNRF